MKKDLQTPEQRKSMRKYEQPWASMSNYELPLTVFVSLQRGSEILGALNQQAAVRWSHQQASPGGPIPQNMAKTFDAPPTL